MSEEQPGLPVILALRFLDRNCAPISALDVDVWHANINGAYSARSSGSSDSEGFDAAFCSGGNAQAQASRWFRGTQVTDSQGIVYFKTCFPGWYPGRTPHIHLLIRKNNMKSFISQLYFEDSLTTEVYTQHDDYRTRGDKDTNNTTDGVTSNFRPLIFNSARNSDGSMLIWKDIQVTV